MEPHIIHELFMKIGTTNKNYLFTFSSILG